MEARTRLDALCMEMMAWNRGNPRRIQHFLKVSALAVLIGRQEGVDAHGQELLEAIGYIHDLGSRIADERFGYHNGKLQEELGPPAARPLLLRLGYSPEDAERLCWLIAHHHSYDAIEALDHRILVEADCLVNLYEHGDSREAIQRSYDTLFRTAAGKRICREMFQLDENA